MNPAIREALDRFTSDMQTALPRILVTAEALPNEPGFGFNLRLRQALGKLSPLKILAERGLTSAYRLFLLWAKASNTPIDGYGPDGKLKRIEPKDIDPRRLYLDAFLKPDVPIERQEEMLPAIEAANALGSSGVGARPARRNGTREGRLGILQVSVDSNVSRGGQAACGAHGCASATATARGRDSRTGGCEPGSWCP